jgi:hypothetical protein
MPDDLNRLTAAVERDLALLRALPPVMLSDECLRRTTDAVVAEAARVRRQALAWRAARNGLVAAAAVLLAVVLVPRWTYREPAGRGDEDTLAAWAAAYDASGTRWAELADAGWSADNGGDADTEVDELFRGLEQSFERFESL